MRLEMQSTWARIGMKTTPAQISIKSPKPELNLETTHPQIKIESTLPKVQIDQSQCFAESGLKSWKGLSDEMVRIAWQEAQNAAGRASSQGSQMANIQDGYDVIAQVADDNAWGQFQKEFAMATMPRSRPQITVIEGQNQIDVTPGKVSIHPKIQKPIVDYTPGKVDIYLKQKNQLTINVVKDRFDQKG